MTAENPVEDLAANATRGLIRGSREALSDHPNENLLVSEVEKIADAILGRINNFLRVALGDVKEALAAVLGEVVNTVEGSRLVSQRPRFLLSVRR